MITYFKDKNHKSKDRYKIYKTLNTILKSVDSIVILGAISTSVTLSITGFGLVIVPISTGIACGLSFGNKLLYEMVMQKYNKYKKPSEKDQQTIESFDRLNRKFLQDNVIDKNEYESLCKIFTKYIDENKKRIFFKNMNIKIKLNYFSNNKLKIQPRS